MNVSDLYAADSNSLGPNEWKILNCRVDRLILGNGLPIYLRSIQNVIASIEYRSPAKNTNCTRYVTAPSGQRFVLFLIYSFPLLAVTKRLPLSPRPSLKSCIASKRLTTFTACKDTCSHADLLRDTAQHQKTVQVKLSSKSR